MDPESLNLLLRKQRLQLRIEQQRAECLAVLQEVEGVMSTAQHLQGLGRGIAALLREHAALGAGLAGLLLLWRPRGAWRWLRRGWLLWLGWRGGGSRLRGWARVLARLAGV